MIGYLMGEYDVLRAEDLRKLDSQIQKCKDKDVKKFALGILADELCQNKPLKSLEDRMKIMSYIKGVDYVFPVTSTKREDVLESMKNAIIEKENEKKEMLQEENEKKYDLSYAPGTYDLFHVGHLENLLEASEHSKKLIAGVKADELVYEHKNKTPNLSAAERAEILRHFKFVNDTYIYYTRNLNTANDYFKSSEGYGKSVDAVFLGSDLKKDFKDVKDLNIVFTERDEKLMKERSTTAYTKKYKVLKLDKNNNKNYTGDIVQIEEINAKREMKKNKVKEDVSDYER